MSDIAVTVTSPGSVNATIGVGGAVSATVSSGGSVAVQLPSGSLAWGDISGKPTEFTPSAHTHQAADITDRSTALVTSVNGQTGDITITEGGGGASLSDSAPAALGLATAGVSLEASRADHVHDLPTAAEVGALDADSVIDGGDYVGYTNAWNLSGPTASASYNVASQTTGPGGVFFKPDGLAMYVVGNGGDGVYQYSLSTAWDVATASFVGSKSVSSQDDFPLGLYFRGDGLRMYVSGSGSSDSVHEYTLATAWNVTTATFSQSVSVATETGIPAGLFFRPDGLKLYVASPLPSRVFEYDLTAAWDVSTASLLNSFVAPSNTEGVFFKPDGLAMFTIDDGGQSTATKYTLSTAWDVSTASLDSSVSLSASVNTPFGLFIKPDGLRMYVSDYNANTVSQFDL